MQGACYLLFVLAHSLRLLLSTRRKSPGSSSRCGSKNTNKIILRTLQAEAGGGEAAGAEDSKAAGAEDSKAAGAEAGRAEAGMAEAGNPPRFSNKVAVVAGRRVKS